MLVDARAVSARLGRSELHVGAAVRRGRLATCERFALVMPADSAVVMKIFLEGFSGKLLYNENAGLVLTQVGWRRALRWPASKVRVKRCVTEGQSHEADE